MRTFVCFLFIVCLSLSIQAQTDSTRQRSGFILRYRPLLLWNGIGVGHYLHPNHSIEVYGTLQATFDLWDPETLWERSVIVEYRYYAVNRQKTRWFIAPFFKHGHSRFVTLVNSQITGGIDFWERMYVKDNVIGGVIGFQFNRKNKRKGQSYTEVFAGPQFMFRQYHERYAGNSFVYFPDRVVKASGGGFVRFGVNFCYDFYRKGH